MYSQIDELFNDTIRKYIFFHGTQQEIHRSIFFNKINDPILESYYLFDEKDGIITEDKNYNNNNTNIDLKNFNIKEKKILIIVEIY